jgi:hypothetical protein
MGTSNVSHLYDTESSCTVNSDYVVIICDYDCLKNSAEREISQSTLFLTNHHPPSMESIENTQHHGRQNINLKYNATAPCIPMN